VQIESNTEIVYIRLLVAEAKLVCARSPGHYCEWPSEPPC